MKYMVSCRQPKSAIRQADEVRVDYRDIDILPDFIEGYQDKEFIIYVPREQECEFKKFEKYRDLLNITFAIEDLYSCSVYKEHRWPYFWSYPISSFYELQGALYLGVSQVLIDVPLCFDLESVKYNCETKNVKIRMVLNNCYNSYMPRENGIYGSYVRPEDVDFYSNWIDTGEFYAEGLQQERTLLKIYQSKEWKGNLNLLLHNLNYDIDNRGFTPEFAARRVSCRQRCMNNPLSCHFCHTTYNLITTIDRNKDWVKTQLK